MNKMTWILQKQIIFWAELFLIYLSYLKLSWDISTFLISKYSLSYLNFQFDSLTANILFPIKNWVPAEYANILNCKIFK